MVSLKKPSLGDKILYEIAIGIVAVILLLGILNTVTHTSKICVLSSDDIDSVKVNYAFYDSNGTIIGYKTILYDFTDVGVTYGGKTYIGIPFDIEQPEGTANIKIERIELIYNTTWKELIDRGLNEYTVDIELLDYENTSYSFIGYTHADASSYDQNSLLYIGKVYTNGTFNGTIDPGLLLIKAANHINDKVIFYINPTQSRYLSGIVIKSGLYVTSEKPILKMFTEPAYGIIAGLWSTLVALYNRIRQYALSFFGGFSISALFTGLIGDPVTALVITAIVIVVFFFALTRPAPRRRHD